MPRWSCSKRLFRYRCIDACPVCWCPAAVSTLRDLGPRGITVQAARWIADMNQADGPDAEGLRKLLTVGRYGQADEYQLGGSC